MSIGRNESSSSDAVAVSTDLALRFLACPVSLAMAEDRKMIIRDAMEGGREDVEALCMYACGWRVFCFPSTTKTDNLTVSVHNHC